MTQSVTGTATDDQDLFAKLITFLTTDAALVLASEEWTEVWDHANGDEDGIVLEGPGLAGTDQIYIGLRLIRDVAADEYTIEVRGMTGYQASAVELEDHVNVQSRGSFMFTDSGSQTYWFIANGRRFVVINKITTVFQALYAGWFLPFGTPSEYPYPMFVGGSSGGPISGTSDQAPDSWRDDVTGHSQFPWPTEIDAGSTEHNTCAWMLDPSGNWLKFTNTGEQVDCSIGPVYTRGNRVRTTADYNDLFDPYETHLRMIDCYGGDKKIFPMTLHQSFTGNQTYGVLDGCYKCAGIGIGAEDVITVSALDHLVVQNTYRTDFFDYWCVELP